MNIKQPQYTFSALALAVVVGLSGPALAQSAAGSSPGAAAPSAVSKAAQPQVDDKAAREADKKRAELTQDAITALTKTQEALTLLDANKTKEALAALELASGKLELVLARDAKLALAPVDVLVICICFIDGNRRQMLSFCIVYCITKDMLKPWGKQSYDTI